MNYLLGAVLGTIALAVGWSQWGPMLTDYAQQPVKDQAAHHLNTVASAADRYIRNNWDAVETAAAGGTVAITPAMLVASGYLDAGFVDTTPFQHAHVALVRLVAADQLNALVVGYGGTAIDDLELARLAPLLNRGNGGSILAAAPALWTQATGDATEALANYAHASYALGAGHLGIKLRYDQTDALTPYVSRYTTPGDPDSGTVFQTLKMDADPLVLAPIAAVGGACPAAGATAAASAGTGETFYCDGATLTWKKPSATSSMVVWW